MVQAKSIGLVRFLELGKNSPHLLPYVKSLDLELPPDKYYDHDHFAEPEYDPAPTAPEMADEFIGAFVDFCTTKLPNLSDLRLRDVYFDAIDGRFQYSIMLEFRFITTLKLHYFYFLEGRDFLCLLASMANLRYLFVEGMIPSTRGQTSLPRTSLWEDEVGLQASRRHLGLEIFIATVVSSSENIGLVAAHFESLPVRIFVVDTIKLSDFTDISLFLRIVGAHLQCLSICLWPTEGGSFESGFFFRPSTSCITVLSDSDIQDFRDPNLLTPCTALRGLHLLTPFRKKEAPRTHHIPFILEQISSTELEEISFGPFSMTSKDLAAYDLKKIDEMLNSSRFPNLKRVIFRLQSFDTIDSLYQEHRSNLQMSRLSRQIWKAMSQLAARRLLVFDTEGLGMQCIPCTSSFFSTKVDMFSEPF